MTALRILLGYYHPWPNDTGIYLARASGETAARGLDLHVAVVDPGRGDTLAHLARGEADAGLAPLNRVLAARSRGEDVTAVAAINQTGLESLHSLRSLGVNRPRDLAGRRVALNPTPRGLAMVRAMIAADGGDPSTVEVVDSGHREWQSRHLAAGIAEAYFGSYWAWDELFDAHPAQDRVSWPVKDHGAPPFHSYVLAARGKVLRERPEEVRALLAALDAGYHRAATDQAEARAVLETVIPYFPEQVLARSLELVATTWFHHDQWGVLRDELITPYARWLATEGALSDLSGLSGGVDVTWLPREVTA